ncbi:hypothetical protein D3OALGB2SA_4835 [Olavius algarvensis associated proteobacterium Delta 3]|nr:hypothetical protein D3OALGB2SA_4835 [Olavius algarvensis associated proteobacterium Delta 3]
MLQFIEAILRGKSQPIPMPELVYTSMATFSTIQSLRSGKAVRISAP